MVPDALTDGPRFAAFCERYVRHTKGRWAGQPLILEDWQREFWWDAFEIDPTTGLRLYQEVGLGIPRKNGKSMQASAAGMYFLVADGEPEPEIYVAAAAKNQAGIVLGQSRRIGQQSPRLLRLIVVRSHAIECPRNGGIMRSLSADAALQHGLNPSANIIDEIHAHKSGELYTALTTGTGAREQPFTLWITTEGDQREGILRDLVSVMDNGPGELEDRGALRIYRDRANGQLIYWYSTPDGADIEDPAVWAAVNPASWRTEDVLRKDYARLKARGALVEWRTYHLNQHVEVADAWMDPDDWAACENGELGLRADVATWVAVRIAHDHRTAGVAIAQRQGDTFVLRTRTFTAPADDEDAYLDADKLETYLRGLRYRARIHVPVRYKEGGKEYHRPRRGPAVAYQSAFFEASKQRLEREGVVMIHVPSTPERLTPAAETLMRLVTARELAHDGDPELARQMGYVVAKPAPKGWSVDWMAGKPVVTAQAAMLAVYLAENEYKPPSRRMRAL